MMKKSILLSIIFALCFTLIIPTTSFASEANSALDKKYVKYEQFIVVDKSENRLYYYRKGELVKSFAVATGKNATDTPEGLFKIREKIKNRPYYKGKIKGGDPKNPLGDRWLGLEVKINGKTSYAYAIHGNNNESSIGKYVSAGCVRMHNKSIHWLYDEVKVGTPVLIQK